MHPIRTVADSRVIAITLANAEPLRFRLLLGLMVLWAIAWAAAIGLPRQYAEPAAAPISLPAATPALVHCEPGAASGESALLRCTEIPADRRLKQT